MYTHFSVQKQSYSTFLKLWDTYLFFLGVGSKREASGRSRERRNDFEQEQVKGIMYEGQ
jgi:hypothetical protein